MVKSKKQQENPNPYDFDADEHAAILEEYLNIIESLCNARHRLQSIGVLDANGKITSKKFSRGKKAGKASTGSKMVKGLVKASTGGMQT